MSSLAAALAKQQNYRSTRCLVSVTLEKLDEADAQALRNALDPQSGLQSSAIRKALLDEGIDVSVQSIQRHRRKDCRCVG